MSGHKYIYIYVCMYIYIFKCISYLIYLETDLDIRNSYIEFVFVSCGG